MTWQATLTLAVVAAMVVALVRWAHVADMIFLGALALLCISGVVTTSEAVAGFHNEGVLTVGALFVVAAGLVETGLLGAAARRLLGNAARDHDGLRRIVPPLIAASAFLNNTTVVAMALPVVLEWTRKRGLSPSRLLLPISYAAILGGVCTLIGTSTNLVIHGMMKQSGLPSLVGGLGMWELGWVGAPIALAGGLYLVFVVPRLLPERKEFMEQLGETRREYLAEIIVEPGCPLIGQTIHDAGLRGLPGLYLIEIERGGELLSAVAPEERLRAGDRLIFTGVVSTIIDLQRIPGLAPAADTTYEIKLGARRGRRLCEAVVSTTSPLIGRGVREANFRTIYDAAVVAVHRNGQRMREKIGDIVLAPGDTLLLETGPGFVLAHRNNPHFFLVSEVGDGGRMRHDRAWLASLIGIGMIVAMTLPEVLMWLPAPYSSAGPWLDQRRVIVALLAAVLMVVARCVSAATARRSVEWSVLLTIAASFGVGTAMARSGAAGWIAQHGLALFQPLGAVGVLAAVYVLTWALTEVMSNNAAAALMFPVAVAASVSLDVDPRPLAITVALGASAGFILPAGYQTHLMVFGPGGYRVGDFVRAGVPMAILWAALTITLVPLIWPLTALR